jgi:DNA-binding CsgD family transcriptional regulator
MGPARGRVACGIDSRLELGTTPPPTDLIGRTKECRSLEELLDTVRGGQGRVLVLRGDAGTGKSALLRHLILSASGFRVIQTTGVESEMELPFAALYQLCSSMFDRLDTLPDPQRDAVAVAFGQATGSAADPLLIGLAVLNLLSAASDDCELLIVVDDAQWLDRESAQALTFVARRLFADQVGLVFATREATADVAGFPEMQVQTLNEADSHALLSSVLYVPLDARVRDRIVAETQGNPLALVEWPRGRTPAELAGGFGMPARPIAGQIEESFRRRLAELPEQTQQLLLVAAADPTGDPVIVWRAASALGVDAGDATPAVDAGLIDLGVRVWFRHPLVRSAVYGSAPLADRQAAHRALATATDPKIAPDRQAWHRALGSPGPDEDIADALERSADRARARGGLAAAGALLERSVALTLDPSRRGARLLGAAAADLEAGVFELVAGLLTAADATPLDERSRAQVEMLRGRLASAGGDVRDAPAVLLRAAKRLEPLDLALASETYLHALGAAVLAGGFAREVDIADVAQAACSRPAAADATINDWMLDGLAHTTVDGPAAAAPILRRVLEAAATDAVEAVPFYLLAHLGGVASLMWDRDALGRLMDRQVTTTRELGALTMLPWALNTLALLDALDGDLIGAASRIDEAEQIVDAVGGNIGMAWSHAILAAWRSDGDAPRLLAEMAEIGHAAGNAQTLKHAKWGSAILYNGTRQYDRAVAAGKEAMMHPADWGTHFYFHELVEAAVRAAEPDTARATLERLEQTAEPSGTDWAIGILRRCQALLDETDGAEALYCEAIERLGRTSLRPELARAHLLYGEWLRRRNRRVDARTQLRTAHEMFTEMGIQGFAERTRHELLATGERVRERSTNSFDELTPQEAHIARLAADGHTNPEIGAQLFISRHTVEFHLRKVFVKLGVASRWDLRDVLPRQVRASHERL